MAAIFETSSSTFLFVSVLATVFAVSVADTCTTSKGGFLDYEYTYCAYGCCGYYPSEYCCSYSVGIIVGSCFAVVAFICVVVAVVCCCVRRRGHPGTIVTTHGQNPMVVCSTNQSAQYPAPYPGAPYGQPMGTVPPPQPPAYSPPQEGYGYSNLGYQQPPNDPFSTAAYAKPI